MVQVGIFYHSLTWVGVCVCVCVYVYALMWTLCGVKKQSWWTDWLWSLVDMLRDFCFLNRVLCFFFPNLKESHFRQMIHMYLWTCSLNVLHVCKERMLLDAGHLFTFSHRRWCVFFNPIGRSWWRWTTLPTGFYNRVLVNPFLVRVELATFFSVLCRCSTERTTPPSSREVEVPKRGCLCLVGALGWPSDDANIYMSMFSLSHFHCLNYLHIHGTWRGVHAFLGCSVWGKGNLL